MSSNEVTPKESLVKVDQQLAPTKQGIVRVKFYLYVEMCENNLQLENHVKRLQNLRKEINYIKDTDWQYEPIEKILGQH
ncbi:uncharacterized protein LOC129768871 [Toxorhynchites rutilus septentrionalis]|uniref:uncharacterized protein LOC129768871 n=1 Tax=Toxorhynchites rutilus septentrionalis TaxID=329112 RepID=UPI002478C1AA|nr:uncharacterized protein LOC129768871 [Toxorhynchites rutilus septentrionalis]